MPVFIHRGQRAVTGQVLVNEAMAPADLVRTDETEKDDQLELAVREHARLVYRVAYSVLRDHHDAEDAVQETFLRVLRYRRKLAGVRDARTWLARIAWRVSVERRRKPTEVALDDVAGVVERLRSHGIGGRSGDRKRRDKRIFIFAHRSAPGEVARPAYVIDSGRNVAGRYRGSAGNQRSGCTFALVSGPADSAREVDGA